MSIEEQINEMRQNVANSYVKVKSKGGTLPQDRNLANLPDAIDSISGGGANLGSLYADQNQTYYPEDYSLDGFSSVEVNVPQNTPVLGMLLATQNNTRYYASDYGFDGFDEVRTAIQIPQPQLQLQTFKYKTLKKTLYTTPTNWSVKTGWAIENSPSARCFWTDGNNFYYSNGAVQLKYDESTDTWGSITWNGWITPNGLGIWTDGTHIYCSTSSLNYELNISTMTWTTKTWNGLTDFEGRFIWTDNTNIYYCDDNNGNDWVLDVATDTWSMTSWQGIHGNDIFTDGVNIYYGHNFDSFEVFENGTWVTINNSGSTIPSPAYFRYIWTDGVSLFLDSNTLDKHLKLDLNTMTSTNITWTGVTGNVDGLRIFQIKDDIYMIGSTGTPRPIYKLDKVKYLTTKTTL